MFKFSFPQQCLMQIRVEIYIHKIQITKCSKLIVITLIRSINKIFKFLKFSSSLEINIYNTMYNSVYTCLSCPGQSQCPLVMFYSVIISKAENVRVVISELYF